MKALATIQQADGRVVGPVQIHGAGGPVAERSRIERAIRRATAGRRIVDLYEPEVGHARAYVGTDERGAVDLRGASLVAWEVAA